MGIVESTYAELKQQELKNNSYSCLHMADIDINPHQVEAFTFALSSLELGGAILADEVGLGKTIEAGLVIKYLLCSGKNKILLIMPSNLRKQWQVELEEKFDIDSLIVDSSNWEDYLAKVRSKQAVIIVSYHFAEYDSQFKYWNSRSKEENEIFPKYYETNIDLEIPEIQHGYLLIGSSYVGEIIEDAVFEIIDITGKIYGASDVLARELCEKLNEQCLEEETPNNQEILLYIDKVDEFMQQKYTESKRTVLIANQKKLDNWLQSRKEEYLLRVKDTSELDELKEKYAIEGDFRQKIALKKQIEILEEQKQKMVRAFHDEMSTLEEETVNMQKQFAEDILVKTQLVTKIVIKF